MLHGIWSTSIATALVSVMLAASCSDDGGDGGGGSAGTTSDTGGTSNGTAGTVGDGGGGGVDNAGGSSDQGAAGTSGTSEYWPDAYDENGLPDPASGEHNAGRACLDCHTSGSREWLLGGTVYLADGTSPAPNVEVGVSDGTEFLSAHSGENGNFWIPASEGSIDFDLAQVRIRTGDGEAVMSENVSGNCNDCHADQDALVAP